MKDAFRKEFGSYPWISMVTRIKAAETKVASHVTARAELAAMMSGDVEIDVSPVTCGTLLSGFVSSADRVVTIQLQMADGTPFTNFTGSLPVGVVADTAGDGDCALAGSITEVDFVAGVATVTIEYTGTWAADDTATLTVGNSSTVLGNALSNKTCVDTFVGTVAFDLDPETLGSSAAAVNAAIGDDGFTRDVVVTLVDGDDEIIPYSGNIPIDITVGTVGDGDASVPAATATMVDGTVTVTVTYTGTWAAEDTCTLTVGDTTTLAGEDFDIDVADATSVDTLIA
jgi:hypothetical protein